MNFELTGVAVVAFSGAVGVIVGWALCHLGHAKVRADARHFRMESDTLRAKAIRFDEHRIAIKKDREILVAEANLLRSKLGLAPMNEIGDLKAAVEARELELAAEAEEADDDQRADGQAEGPELANNESLGQAQAHGSPVVDLTDRERSEASKSLG